MSAAEVDAEMAAAYAAPAAEGQIAPPPAAEPIMLLDAPARAALNLLPAADKKDAQASNSLFGVLNHGRTAMSPRLLRQWLCEPLVTQASIERRQDYVELVMSDHDLYSLLYDTHLKQMPDIERICDKLKAWGARAASKKVDQEAQIKLLVSCHNTITRLPDIVTILSNYRGTHESLLTRDMVEPLRDVLLPDVGELHKMVEETVDLAAVSKHEYRMQPAGNSSLLTVDNKIQDAKQAMVEECRRAAATMRLEDNKVKLTKTPNHGWCFRVTRKDEKSMRDHRDFITCETKKDGVYFATVAQRDLAKDLRDYEQRYQALQEGIVIECMSIAHSFLFAFQRINSIITELDIFVGFAHASMNAPIPYVRPTLLPLGSGVLELRDARHPCVEASFKDSTFIPNNVTMEENASRFQIITGPNMGGKSTYIRMVGVLSVMAQVGCPLPVSSARLSILEKVLARVGAGDNTQEGVSTFMAEMMEADTILKGATKNSLVIIDELGRGTSTYDGFGLAWAISEELAQNTRCFAFFATHFAELPALATELPCVKNLHVTAHTDANSITMLYKVQEGVSDRSFGVHVAQVAGFPAEVVRCAREKVKELERYSGDISLILHTKDGEDESKQNTLSSSQDPSITPSPSNVRLLNTTGKRVLPDREGSSELAPVPRSIQHFLTGRPLTDFQDAHGEIDMDKWKAWCLECKAMARDEAAGVAPMETS